MAVRLFDGDRERHQVEPAADGFVYATQSRLVIPGYYELELRKVGKEVLPHEARRDGIAARQRLDLALGPAAALLRFLRGDETGAAQPGEIRRMPLALRRDERLHWRHCGVVAEHGRKRVEEDTLAVAARAVEEEKRMVAGRAGEAVSGDALQEPLQLLVVVCDLGEKLAPARAGAIGRGRRDLRHVRQWIVRQHHAGA